MTDSHTEHKQTDSRRRKCFPDDNKAKTKNGDKSCTCHMLLLSRGFCIARIQKSVLAHKVNKLVDYLTHFPLFDKCAHGALSVGIM